MHGMGTSHYHLCAWYGVAQELPPQPSACRHWEINRIWLSKEAVLVLNAKFRALGGSEAAGPGHSSVLWLPQLYRKAHSLCSYIAPRFCSAILRCSAPCQKHPEPFRNGHSHVCQMHFMAKLTAAAGSRVETGENKIVNVMMKNL